MSVDTMAFDPRISIVTLGVRDMAVAREFYQKLGWPLDEAQSNEQVSFFQGKGVVLGLFGWDPLAEDAGAKAEGHGFRGTSIAYNCSSEEEVDAAFAHAISIGATAMKSPKKVFWGGYSGYFADPDGHLWEVAFNPFFGSDEDGHMILSVDQDGGDAE